LTILLLPALIFAQQVFDRHYTFGTDTWGFAACEIQGLGYYIIGTQDSLAFDSLGQPVMDYWQGIIVRLDHNGDTIKTFQIGNADTMYTYLYGGNSDDFFRTAMVTDDGNIIVAGETQSYNADNYYDGDLWLLKFDPNLNLIWNKQFSIADTQLVMNYAQGEKLSNGGILLPGHAQDHLTFADRFRITAFDSSGNMMLHKVLLPHLSGAFLGASETSDGGYMAAGMLYNVIQHSNLSPIVVKTDSAGNVDWYHVLPYSGDRHAAQDVMATTDGNNIYSWARVAWRSGASYKVWIPYLTKIDVSGNELWTKEYNYSFDMLRRIKPMPDGKILVTGWHTDTVGSGKQALLMLCDANGDSLWVRKFSGPDGPAPGDFVIPMDATHTSDGGFILTGLTTCCNFTPNLGWSSSLWVLKTDSLGLITSVSNAIIPLQQGAAIGDLFPNPASDYCIVNTLIPPTEYIGYGEKGAYLLLFDLQGKQLQKIEVSDGLNHTRIDFSHYANGEYLVVLAVDGFNAGTKKILVQR